MSNHYPDDCKTTKNVHLYLEYRALAHNVTVTLEIARSHPTDQTSRLSNRTCTHIAKVSSSEAYARGNR
jgi:hypothetical protein